MAQDILARLQENIEAVKNNPSTPLDQRTFDNAELVLSDQLNPEQKQQLVSSIASLLQTLTQDATPAVNLLLSLLKDATYSEIIAVADIPYVVGLSAGEHMVAFNRLILAILGKASQNAADTASVANDHDIVLALVRLWLCTGDTGVTTQASRLLIDFLKIDQEFVPASSSELSKGGQGLFWRRVFGDRDVYGTFFEACSAKGSSSLKLSKNERSLAQARLMEWLPQVGMLHWETIVKSHHSDIESAYAVEGGLLDLVSIRIAQEAADDVLLQQCLISFYTTILREPAPFKGHDGAITYAPGLDYLIKKDLHEKTASIYLQQPGSRVDPLEAMFLYGPAADYLATYASAYPTHFLSSTSKAQVLDRLELALNLSPTRFAHAEVPKHDLHLLASLPRRALLDGTSSAKVLHLLPSRPTHPDVLNTLAVIFHGPQREITFPTTNASASEQEESAYACALYYHYLAKKMNFWKDVAEYANTVALTDTALAAINCLTAVITAQWAEPPADLLPTSFATPSQGFLAILTPPALEYTLPYLLKPPQTFANLVGGRGDAESAAYKIASAKFDALAALHRRLQMQVQQQPGIGYESILSTVSKRLAAGPFSREGEVGGRIATLEL